ncbi:acylneuraminate cytidylyltransferase family protein [Shimia sp. NS0008-38b]|uniref:acylneuraminate cytidylyltransferase family protein n=1 Tax=Shimia sp. NS0008-38b TaxID=3127653 RepID=UPI0031082351
MILGHIGARQGSKGVVGKNFREINGKPLIDWSLDMLLAHPLIDQVVVSTDDEQMYEHSVAKGALEIGLRPAELATDAAPKWGVWQHALSASEAITGQDVEAFLDLDCTNPLRIPEDITGALSLYQAENPDMVMSVCEARKNPYFNLVEPDENGALQVSKQLSGGVWARQAAPVVYEHVGCVYVVAPAYLKRAKTLYEGRVLPYEIPSVRGFDIDEPHDFGLVEYLLKELQNGRL